MYPAEQEWTIQNSIFLPTEMRLMFEFVNYLNSPISRTLKQYGFIVGKSLAAIMVLTLIVQFVSLPQVKHRAPLSKMGRIQPSKVEGAHWSIPFNRRVVGSNPVLAAT